MIKCVSILGSTGSVGRQTLEVMEHLGIGVAALTANENVEKMRLQCEKYRPRLAVMGSKDAAEALKAAISHLQTEVLWGEEGLIAAATAAEADCIITAVVGMVGLKPTLAAIRAGKRIGLANKETLVCAGQLVMAEARKYNAQIIPVDSEHSAIFQCLMGVESGKEIKKILLTCSGGPFYEMERESLKNVTKADALRHPNWKMGPKITVDCATLMNKGLEVIEAMHMFGLPLEKIQVLIHRQSIVHSMVELTDGSVMAQLGAPDMRIPIQLALTYPERRDCIAPSLDLLSCGPLTFAPPDEEAFPCLALARKCARMGGTACAAMNGANEEAVALFLADKIGFYDIYRLVCRAVEETPFVEAPTLEEILEADRLARQSVHDQLF